jgi:hypothetical protein
VTSTTDEENSMDGAMTVQDVLVALDGHAAHEATLLQDYQRAARMSDDPQLRLLMNLILQDEERHHVISKALVMTIESALSGVPDEGAVPAQVAQPDAAVDGDLLELTNRFIVAERRGIDEDRWLSRMCEGLNDGLLSLLLETMIQDSRKHLKILEFVRDRLRSRIAAVSRRS